MLFVYPAWIFLVIAPWALLPLKWAVAFWTGSLLFGILHLIGALVFRWGGRRLGPTSLWATVLPGQPALPGYCSKKKDN